MSFTIPTPQDLRDQNYNELEAEIQGSNPRLQNSFLNGISKMDALSTHGCYIYLKYLFKQIFVETADSEFLELHGSPLAIDRTEALSSSGNVDATGNEGTDIPQDTLLQRSDGAQYRVTTGQTISAGVASLPVESVDFGLSTNAVSGDTLTFVSPIAGIDSTAMVDSDGLNGGADTESDEDYRERILERKRKPPQGGAVADYVTWAKEVANVTRAWAYSQRFGDGSVGLFFMMDDKYSDGIPLSADITAVEDYINAESRRPVTADLVVQAPTAQTQAFDITISPDTPTIRANVEAEIKDMLQREIEVGGSLLVSKVREAVSIAAGENDNTVNTPSADVAATSTNHIIIFDSITFS